MGLKNAWREHLIRRYERKLAKLRAETNPAESSPTTSSVYSGCGDDLVINGAQFLDTHQSVSPELLYTSQTCPPIQNVSRFEFNRLQVELAEQFTQLRTEVRDVLGRINISHSTPVSNCTSRSAPPSPDRALDDLFKPSHFDRLDESSMFESSPDAVVQPLKNTRRALNDVANSISLQQHPIFKKLAI